MSARQVYERYRTSGGQMVYTVVERGARRVLSAAPWLGGVPTGLVLPDGDGRLVCCVEPSKILCIGRNYRQHAKEMNAEVPTRPLLFLKPPSSLLDPGGVVLLPPESERVEHEGELGVVMGKRARRVSRDDAMDYVFGFTIVGDITARDLQRADGQWSRGKGFDTFCPVGPAIVKGIDHTAQRLVVSVNGQVRQQGVTSDMIFDVATLVSELSQAMTLMPGDLIATGTPEGVGPLVHGDLLRIEIEDIGVLDVQVRDERRADATAESKG